MKILRCFWGIYLILALFGPIILRSQDPYQDTYVVYYFGATNCGYCNIPANIEKIKQVRNEYFKRYPDFNTKYVFVCMDRNIEEGLEFIKKNTDIGMKYQSAVFTITN